MTDEELIQKGQDDLIRRGDALNAAWEADSLELSTHGAGKIEARINAIPAVQPTVKPLVWKHEADNAWASAHYTIHQYWPHNNGMFCLYGYLGGIGASAFGKHPTLEAAKAAAQADYEARILSALDMQPTVSPKQLAAQPDDVAALVDALRDLMMHEPDYPDTIWENARAALALIEKEKSNDLP